MKNNTAIALIIILILAFMLMFGYCLCKFGISTRERAPPDPAPSPTLEAGGGGGRGGGGAGAGGGTGDGNGDARQGPYVPIPLEAHMHGREYVNLRVVQNEWLARRERVIAREQRGGQMGMDAPHHVEPPIVLGESG